jgi:hypothetical protein
MTNIRLALAVTVILLSGSAFAVEDVKVGSSGTAFLKGEASAEEGADVTVQADGTAMSVESTASAEDVAKKLANPVAAMISVPIQPNYQPNMGLNDEGSQWLTNVQPVVPISLNDDWNIISRTIVPLVSKDTGIAGQDRINSVGDIVQSAWLSPKEPTESGWIWGVGAAALIPTDTQISAEKWGLGPTGLALRQEGPWTYGGLFNHIWSFAGSDINDPVSGDVLNNVNQTFMQPFLTYITPQSVTFALNTETIYDWEREQWTVPINFVVTKVMKIGDQVISAGGGITYWAEAPDGGPEGLGVRLLLVFIFPK